MGACAECAPPPPGERVLAACFRAPGGPTRTRWFDPVGPGARLPTGVELRRIPEGRRYWYTVAPRGRRARFVGPLPVVGAFLPPDRGSGCAGSACSDTPAPRAPGCALLSRPARRTVLGGCALCLGGRPARPPGRGACSAPGPRLAPAGGLRLLCSPASDGSPPASKCCQLARFGSLLPGGGPGALGRLSGCAPLSLQAPRPVLLCVARRRLGSWK